MDSIFGFLSGAVAAGAATYYYILGDYRLSNDMLTEDIYVCSSSCFSACVCVALRMVLWGGFG